MLVHRSIAAIRRRYSLRLARVGDGEWFLQLFPFVCGLAVIPLTGAVVSRITGGPYLGVAAAAAIVFAVRDPLPSRYYDVDDAFTVEELARVARQDDAVLVYPWASWLVAYYSNWPYQLQRSDDWMCDFLPQFTRANTQILEVRPRRLDRQLAGLLGGREFSNVFYIATRENRQPV